MVFSEIAKLLFLKGFSADPAYKNLRKGVTHRKEVTPVQGGIILRFVLVCCYDRNFEKRGSFV